MPYLKKLSLSSSWVLVLQGVTLTITTRIIPGTDMGILILLLTGMDITEAGIMGMGGGIIILIMTVMIEETTQPLSLIA